ncbi:calmodulin-binding transcription activator 1 [Phtheirospermum japonicum]|uniref:Calmodulin-binding transcription activator 1 n=1 Tax=Phtheirospermum japonicum TaxID=374723 RepID=A0A830BGR9_9LAMI|nr:calmodulin-binding transcription activator 1 [Phtheirospermum japonicum]
MADITRFTPDQPLADLEQLREEALHRWFRPPEICEILSNHSSYHLHSQPPLRPSAGSLFLFDRKVLRYFRKDGYNWKKKKDGKTIKEAHEKLKVVSHSLHYVVIFSYLLSCKRRQHILVSGVDALHCYYAHGEDNENFQRRIYWLLDMQLEHIVLVHYRQVNEGHKIGHSSFLTTKDPGSQLGNDPETIFTSWSEKPSSYVQASYASNPNMVDWNEHRSDSGCHGCASEVHSIQASATDTTFVDNEPGFSEFTKHSLVPGLIDGSYISSTSSFWADDDAHRSSKTLGFIEARLDVDEALQNGLLSDTHDVSGTVSDERAELKKLDSFGRWMDKEIGKDCDDSLMASDSADYWNALDDKQVSSLSCHMQLDSDSVGPSLSQEQLFSISDVAPAWAYSGSETKVLIMGSFLMDKKTSDDKWCCMFGDIEVSCEVLSENVIRCRVPPRAPGCVPFYVTCGNRLACSEVWEFEFLKNPLRVESMHKFNTKIAPEEEVSMQIRLAKLLCLGLERKWLDCSAVECENCKVQKTKLCNLMEKSDDEVIVRRNYFSKDTVIQDLLKDKLYEWLVCKAHEESPHVFDDEGLGVIHLAASLGYVWALGPIISASVISPNFRDKQGRTPLHWASFFGREEVVIALMKLGAAAGAVDDPTPEFPGGRKAADVASDRGHKGIAGYLAEADLTTHLHSLSVTDDHHRRHLLTAAEEFVPPMNAGILDDDDLSLKGSLAAVRKSAQAAATIQASFRAHSFRLRQQTTTTTTQCCNSDDDAVSSVALGSLNNNKVGHFDDYLHSAAIKIQQKCRGWKARKDFLRIRNRIVRIQAHVRGHQVRKQYKKVIWSVSIVEKAILRWRRKKPGLRGFRTEKERINDEDDEYDYLRVSRKLKVAGVEKALARVQSMVRHPEARDQYMRLVRLGNLKVII